MPEGMFPRVKLERKTPARFVAANGQLDETCAKRLFHSIQTRDLKEA